MRKRLKLLIFAVLLPLLALGGCGALIAMRMRPKPNLPRSTEVARGDVVIAVKETGIIEPVNRVEVKSKVAGRLLELVVDEGDVVREGQLIARLDVPELEAQSAQTRAQLEAAEARLRQAKLALELERSTRQNQIDQVRANFRAAEFSLQEASTRVADAQRIYDNRQRLLEMGGYASRDEVESARAALNLALQQKGSTEERLREQQAALAIAEARRTELRVAESRVEEAAAAVRQIQDSLTEIQSRLNDAVIVAPVSGVVLIRHVRAGELITAVSYYGAGVPIVTIGDVSTMLVKVNLNEVDIDKISLSLPVDITADALRDRTFTGSISRIAPSSIPPQGEARIIRFPIEISIDPPTTDLRPGMTANVEIICEKVEDVLWVPNDAVFEKEDQPGKKFVTIVLSEDKGERTTEDREITVGCVSDARTQIFSGLQEGDEIELDKIGAPPRKTIDIRRESEREESGD